MEPSRRASQRRRRLKGRLPVIPRERNGGVYLALAGYTGEPEYLKGVVHITIQTVVAVVTIIWFGLQIYGWIDDRRNKKK